MTEWGDTRLFDASELCEAKQVLREKTLRKRQR